MGNRQRAILGAALLVLGCIGIWLWSTRRPDDTPPPQPAADLHARALLRIEVPRAGSPPADAESRWLEEEVRYLLTRAQVALASPQGPFDPEDGATLFTLRIDAGEQPTDALTLSLVDPEDRVERKVALDAAVDRLGRMRDIAERLPQLLPRGDTGADLATFLGTSDAVAYEDLARLRMAADGGEIRQSGIRTRDTPVDQLAALTRRQPDFARAWTELALFYLRIDGEDAPSLTALAEQAASRALALDPRLADAHTALGLSQQRRGQWLPADASLAQALALDPASGPALAAFTCLLADSGRVRYATLIGEQAVRVAPESEAAAECLAFAQLAAGTTPAAGNSAGGGGAARPRALAALLAGRTEEARALLASIAVNQAGFPSLFAAVASAIEQPELRPQALRAITQAASDEELNPETEVLYGVALRQPDFVFNRLLRLKAQRGETPARFLWMADASFLREHPRFVRVAETLGLTAYWQERGQPDLCTAATELAICRSLARPAADRNER